MSTKTRNETIEDIIAEMRERAEAMEIHGTTRGVRLTIREFAARINLALERDRTFPRSIKIPIEVVPELAGNAAAMREALEFLRDKELDLLEGNVRRCVGLTVFGLEQACKIIRGVIEEALSAPPRNCDRHGGWLTALKRFNDTDGRDNPWGDDVFDSSFLDWLFAPATEGGAK